MSKIQQQEPVSVKIVLVGNHLVGKTSICKKYVHGDNFQDFQSNQENDDLIKSFNAIVKVDQNILNIGIWDTAVREQCSNVTRFAYADADVFLIVFSLSSPQTLEDAINNWHKQVDSVVPSACKIFVGNKEDLRFSSIQDNDEINILSREEIRNKIQIPLKRKYLQCSAVSGKGIANIFEQSVRMVLKSRLKQQMKTKKKLSMIQKCGQCQVM